MRKKLLTLITLVMATIIAMSSLSGCNLITTDTERDMNQVVAVVQIDTNAPKEEILKRDMVMAYLNYGYQYEQYYGYTRDKVFTMIIDNLVQTRVYVQNAMSEFEEGQGDFKIELDSNFKKFDIDRYLTEPERVNAEYLAKKDMTELIKSYAEAEEEEKKDALTEEVRTTPTNATNAEKEEPSKEDQEKYQINTDDKTAYTKVINLFEANDLLGEYNGDVTTTRFFKETVNNYKESKLLEKYENCIRKGVREQITFDDIKDAYSKKYQKQSEWTNAEFVSALSSATMSDPVLVSNGVGYGYVYNLLLGASNEQTTAIGEIDKKLSIAEKAVKRAEILESTKVKDLRSSWITSGYDFDFESKKFTGDYTFTTKDNSLAFKGEVELIKEATEEKSAEYKVNSVTEYNLKDFVDMMETYIYGEVKTAESNDNPSVYKKVNASGDIVEYNEKINELLFAFSTDSGSLNTFKGYAIKPIPDGGNSEEYMQEFADAGRELLKMGDKSYIMVATDYGYHVMFYSMSFDSFDCADLDSYLDTIDAVKDWEAEFELLMSDYNEYKETESYLYLLTDSVVSTKVNNVATNKQRDVLNKYVYDEDTCGVTWYKDRYADLLA